jgi:hypothetical protein
MVFMVFLLVMPALGAGLLGFVVRRRVVPADAW